MIRAVHAPISMHLAGDQLYHATFISVFVDSSARTSHSGERDPQLHVRSSRARGRWRCLPPLEKPSVSFIALVVKCICAGRTRRTERKNPLSFCKRPCTILNCQSNESVNARVPAILFCVHIATFAVVTGAKGQVGSYRA